MTTWHTQTIGDQPLAASHVLLRRKSTIGFETDSAPILCRLLQAQGWMLASYGARDRMAHFVGEDHDYAQIKVFASGLVLGIDEPAQRFLASLVEWCGGRDE